MSNFATNQKNVVAPDPTFLIFLFDEKKERIVEIVISLQRFVLVIKQKKKYKKRRTETLFDKNSSLSRVIILCREKVNDKEEEAFREPVPSSSFAHVLLRRNPKTAQRIMMRKIRTEGNQ